MSQKTENDKGCCENETAPCESTSGGIMGTMPDEAGTEPVSCCCGNEAEYPAGHVSSVKEEVCCGPPPAPQSGSHEQPGYAIEPFVDCFIDSQSGKVPRISTRLKPIDFLGTVNARLGTNRNNYKIAPGLYCVGNTGPESPVLVTANYKLTVDALRKELDGLDCWILVLDTRGINVWCAAGKQLFSTEEVIRRVKLTGVEKIVQHRQLILPQLSATGVSAKSVKKGCGFKVVWGPVYAKDIRRFLAGNQEADTEMRRVTFSTRERLVLIPIEFGEIPRHAVWILLAAFILSGIGPGVFSFSDAWFRGWLILAAVGSGLVAGTVLVPALLPWIPGRSFSVKGVFTGLLTGFLLIWYFRHLTGALDSFALLLCVMTFSSFLAMNFTGSTPFTSPSGVEKEMRKAIPVQAAALLVAAVTWVGSAFAG